MADSDFQRGDRVSVLEEQPRLTLTQLANREKKAISTVWRWCLKGCRGVVLETFLVGGRRHTTGPAFERFIASLNESSSQSAPAVPVRTSRQREAAIRAAERELRRAGV